MFPHTSTEKRYIVSALKGAVRETEELIVYRFIPDSEDDMFLIGEKILFDIENVLKKNPSLKIFEIIPVEGNKNQSPVFHNKDSLGLASWCVQPLYCYAHRRLLELRQNKHRRVELSSVARWLMGALLLNPDVTTFWNMRRELVRGHKLEISDELFFTRLVLYHKPKCFEAFAYRRWLLSYILNAKDEHYDPEPAESPLCTELNIATTCADRYANNYLAWSHRRHIMALRESRGFTHPTLETEWKNSLAWCQQHVSDYSGFSYRQFLMNKYMFNFKKLPKELFIECPDLGEQCKEELLSYIKSNISDIADTNRLQRLLDTTVAESEATTSSSMKRHAHFRALSYWLEECRANDSAICMYDDHEVLWWHRRFLAYLLVRFMASEHSNHRDEHETESIGRKDVEKTSATSMDDSAILCHDFLVQAFRARTEKIADLASKRDQHEKMLAERFFKFLRSIGFENRS